jgi:hypothetical protein
MQTSPKVPRTYRMTWEDMPHCVLTPYLPHLHGIDILLDIWSIAASHGQHIQAFGPVAATPQGFVTTYMHSADMLIIHHVGAPLPRTNIFALAWVDDAFFPARARAHGFVLPVARHGVFVKHMAGMVLSHLFDLRGFHLLYEIIPVTYKPSLRLAKACGFERRTVLEKGAMDPTGPVDGVVMVLTRERWLKGGTPCRG